MKEPVKILFIVQDLMPYLPETVMARVARELPQYVQEQGCEIRIFMPCYGIINERRNQLHEVQRLSGMNLIIDDSDHPLIIKVASLPQARMQVYFIDSEDFFRRRGTAVDADGNEYDDNDDRMIFFARGVLETIKKLRWAPDIIHCHGWMTSLVPMYIRTAYRDDAFFQNSKLIYSDYGNLFTKTFDKKFAKHILTKGVSEADVAEVDFSAVNYEDVARLATKYVDIIDAGSAEAIPELEKIAATYSVRFSAYDEEFKQKYMQLYSDLCPAIESD